jgi:hypothetical protein
MPEPAGCTQPQSTKLDDDTQPQPSNLQPGCTGSTLPPQPHSTFNVQPSPAPWLTALQQTTTQAMIAASCLPQASQARLTAQLTASPTLPVSPDDVTSAIETERKYLAALQESQVIQLPGQPPRAGAISGMRTDLDRLTLALDALIAGSRAPDGVQPLTGLRELYHLLSGDYEMSGLFHSDRIQFANVNSSTMAALVANALNKRLINEFQQYPQWWAPIVTVEDFTNLQTVRWITLGGVGELPTVAEGAAYTELTWDDKTETAAFVKKGGYLGITSRPSTKMTSAGCAPRRVRWLRPPGSP